MYLSTVSVAEIHFGIESLPVGARRQRLLESFEHFLTKGFDERILDFDLDAAWIYGKVMGHRRRIGRPMAVADGQIAAIALGQGLVLATRNVKDFEETGLVLCNPFPPND